MRGSKRMGQRETNEIPSIGKTELKKLKSKKSVRQRRRKG